MDLIYSNIRGLLMVQNKSVFAKDKWDLIVNDASDKQRAF